MTQEQAAAQPQQLATTQTDVEILRQINSAIEENTQPSDLLIPRLAIVQSKSPEIEDEVPGYKVGQLVDNITREVLTEFIKQPWLKAAGVKDEELKEVHCMPFVPIFKLPTEYIEWIPRSERKPEDELPYRFKTLDRNDPKVRAGVWKSLGGTYTGKKPPVTDNTNFLILPLDLNGRCPRSNITVATFSRTSARAGKQLTSLLQSQRLANKQYWDTVFWLWTKQEEFTDGKCYVMHIARGPRLDDVVDPFVREMIVQTAKALSDPKTGHMYQTIMINAAHLDVQGGGDSSEEVSSGNSQQSAEDDPFGKADQPSF